MSLQPAHILSQLLTGFAVPNIHRTQNRQQIYEFPFLHFVFVFDGFEPLYLELIVSLEMFMAELNNGSIMLNLPLFIIRIIAGAL